MVIHDLHTLGSVGCPAEAESPLVVDPIAVFALAITRERFQAVPWRRLEIREFSAACRCMSLRSATALREDHRRAFPVSNSACVSLQRKLLIMREILYRLTVSGKLDRWPYCTGCSALAINKVGVLVAARGVNPSECPN